VRGVRGRAQCNVMKYTHSEERFIEHCVAVARHNVGVDSFVGDVADEGIDDEEGEEARGEEARGEEEGAEAAKDEDASEMTERAEEAQRGEEAQPGEEASEGGVGRASDRAEPSIVPCDTWEGDDEDEDAEETVEHEAEAGAKAAANPFAEFAFPVG
jgi:hypothetical protein